MELRQQRFAQGSSHTNIDTACPIIHHPLPDRTSRIIAFVSESFGQPGLRQPPVLEVGGYQPLGGFPWHWATPISHAGS